MSTPQSIFRVIAPSALIVASLLQVCPARAHDDDPWLGRDKVLHFSVSVALGGVGYGGAAWWVRPPWQRAALGGAFALSLGAAKEIYDASGRVDASWRDFTWDIAGAAVGVGIASLIDFAARRGSEQPAPLQNRR
jgi:putative lipoprotein